MRKGKHWTAHLPEAGTIAKKGEAQFAILDKMDALHDERMRLNAEYNEREEELNKIALTQWTPEEIELAKEDAKKPTATFNIGGVDYFRKSIYKGSPCEVIDCFGGANQKCKIEMWNEEITTVDTDELELTEAK